MTSIDTSLNFLNDIPALKENDVHLWSFTFPSLESHLETLKSFFSEYEYLRIKGIINETYKNQYIASRGLLRYLLSHYAQKSPAELCILPTSTGKPHLDPNDNAFKINFNVSHSHENLLFAFTKNDNIGVDVEYVNERTDIDLMIPSICSEQEQYYLNAIKSDEATRDYFFYLWTRKEALLKNTGEGITVDLSHHDVTLASEKQHPITSKHTPVERGIVLYSLRSGKGYWTTIAKQGIIDNIYLWVNPNVVAALHTNQ